MKNKTSISPLVAQNIVDGAPTTYKTNITYGSICENSVIIYNAR